MRSNNWRWTQTWLCFSLPMQLRWISIWRKPMPPEGAFWDMNMVGLSCRNAIGYTRCLILKCNSMIACFDLDLNEPCTAYSSKVSTLQQGLQGTHPRTKWPFETIGVFQIHVTLKIHVCCGIRRVGLPVHGMLLSGLLMLGTLAVPARCDWKSWQPSPVPRAIRPRPRFYTSIILLSTNWMAPYIWWNIFSI